MRRRRKKRRSRDELEEASIIMNQRRQGGRQQEGSGLFGGGDIMEWQQTLGNKQTTRMLDSRAGEFRPDMPLPDEEVRHAQDLEVRETEGGAEDSPDLEAPRFKGDRELEQVHDGNRLIRMGSRGEPVRKIQQGLIDAGFPLPQFGADAIFGSETRQAVIAFQEKRTLSQDGIVGPKTMGALDDLFAKGGGGGGGGGGTPKPETPKATLNVSGNDSYADTATESRKNVKFNVNWTGGKHQDFVVVNWLQGYMKRPNGTFFKVKMYGNLVDFNFSKFQVDSIDKDPVYWSDDKKRWNYIVDGKNKFHGTDSPGPMFTSDGKGAEAKVDFKVAVYLASDVEKKTSGEINAKPIHEFQPWTYHVHVLGDGKFKHNL